MSEFLIFLIEIRIIFCMTSSFDVSIYREVDHEILEGEHIAQPPPRSTTKNRRMTIGCGLVYQDLTKFQNNASSFSL